jgi:hypothetical protein
MIHSMDSPKAPGVLETHMKAPVEQAGGSIGGEEKTHIEKYLKDIQGPALLRLIAYLLSWHA